MPKFISCDWGTSALRLRLIDSGKASILAEVISDQGISGAFVLWKQRGGKEEERLSFYQYILSSHIEKLEQQLNFSLLDVPLIISGMASSSMGMMELPYRDVPYNVDGNDLYTKIIGSTRYFRHTILVISGVKSADDVMRGEEIQLTGCFDSGDTGEQLFIFPGTHSKHVMVNNGMVVNFETYMTGEFFELLSIKSVLSNNVEKNKGLLSEGNLKSFEKGVEESLHSNILHSSFLVRTNFLFGKISRQENYFFLSGLLIGTELKELFNSRLPLTIVSDEAMIKFYGTALSKLAIYNIKYKDVGKAVVDGHCKIYNLYSSKLAAGQ